MSRRTNDLFASVVVFLVALPLCMGISIASGVPPALGLITGIIGGIVVGSLAGAPLQVSGPAAGLTVLVFELVSKHGIQVLGPVVLLAGVLQMLAGRLKVGQWFRAMSPAVIYGMLAGIGVLIFASQFHVMLDDQPGSSGLRNLLSIPKAIVGGIFPIDGSSHELAALVGILTITALIAWDKLKRGPAKLIPGALVGVMLGSAVATIFQLPVKYVKVPENLLDAVTLPSMATLGLLADPALITTAVALAFIASAETLLSASAVDRMQTLYKTDYDKELFSQGVGNTLCGILGALPMTGVIVRSSANVQAGAQTRLSAILHAVWLLAFVGLLPALLRMIPTAALGAILVYTGYKLVNPKTVKVLRQYGKFPVVIYASTVIMIVCTDLLTGVLTGIALSVVKLVYTVTYLDIKTRASGDRVDVELIGTASFIKLPKIAATLEAVSRNAEVHVHIQQLVYIDHTCLDMMTSWREQHQKNGGRVFIEWDGLHRRFESFAHVPQSSREPEPSLVGR